MMTEDDYDIEELARTAFVAAWGTEAREWNHLSQTARKRYVRAARAVLRLVLERSKSNE